MAQELSFSDLRKLSGNTDITDVPCPLCAGECKTNEGRRRKCLRIWDNGDNFISYTCARCTASGFAKPSESSTTQESVKVEKSPAQKQDKSELCRYLWERSLPAIGSIVQTYLQIRKCCPAHIPTSIRFLPGKDKHPPAMICRFGFEDEPLTGIHLTKLLPDGSGKIRDGDAKLTMGDTVGQPIIINTNDDRSELLIAEGIEDTGSLTIVTGWSGWAAGTAGRIPAVVNTAMQRGYRKIYVAKDVDNIPLQTPQSPLDCGKGASKRALKHAASFGPIIPLPLGGLVDGYGQHFDANKILIEKGPEWLMAAIEFCEWHDELIVRHDKQLPHEFNRKTAHLRKILFPKDAI